MFQGLPKNKGIQRISGYDQATLNGQHAHIADQRESDRTVERIERTTLGHFGII